jgi:MFS family permease
MPRLLLATIGLFSGYHGLLVLTPLYLAAAGANEVAIGAATGSFMFFAVGGHIGAPAVISAWGTRRPFLVVLLGTGAAALAQVLTTSVAAIIVISAVRGVMYGIGAVISATAVAYLSPPATRAGALARYGSAAALPGLLGSTAAVYLAQEASFPIAFAAVAAATLATSPLLVERGAADLAVLPEHDEIVGPLGPAALIVSVIFAGFAMVYGAALTFVPAQLAAADAAAYPFVLSTALGLATFRWGGGTAVRIFGAGATLASGLALGCLAMIALAMLPPDLAFLGGLVFGAGFGMGATATHSILTTLTERASLGKANAIFNVAWSGGMGLGAMAFGVAASASSVTASYELAAGWHVLLGIAAAVWIVATSRPARLRHRDSG